MTIGEALNQAQSKLNEAGINSARLDSQILLEFITNKPREWLLTHSDEPLSPQQTKSYQLLTSKRANRTPLVHLTGQREFYGLELAITPTVLTPRVETEKIVDLALHYAPKSGSLIDVGTGSGAIAIAVKKHRPDLEVFASDISQEIITLATKNALKHKAEIKFHVSSLFDSITGQFDVVTANLPYLENDSDLMPEVQKEPAVALFGGADGLELYRQFFRQLPKHLAPNGYVFIESDPWQQPALIKEAERAGLKVIEQDYFILGFKQAAVG